MLAPLPSQPSHAPEEAWERGPALLEPRATSLISLPETCAPRSQRQSVTRMEPGREREWRCHGTGIRDDNSRALDRRPAGPLGRPGGHARSALETASADGGHVDGIVGTLSEETVANPHALPSASQLLPLTALSICVYLPPESGLASPERRPGKARRSRRPARST